MSLTSDSDEEAVGRTRSVVLRRAASKYATEQDLRRSASLTRRILNNPSLTSIDLGEGDAIHQLLKHVHLDPDGGLLNLVHDTSAQASKLPALKKDTVEKALALVAAIRSVANPVAMMFASSYTLKRQLFSEHGLEHLRSELARLRLGIIAEHAFIGANIAEFLLAVGCILLTFYRVCLIIHYKLKKTQLYKAVAEQDITAVAREIRSREEEDMVAPRFMHEATFWITDLPRLQNLSVLRLLAFVHPNLLVKRQKNFSIRDELARAILEGVFRCNGKYWSDAQLSSKVADVILQHRQQDNRQFAEESFNWRPSDALSKLRAWVVEQGRLDIELYNPDMLDKAWRMDLLLFGEFFCFWSLMLICFMLGMIEFVHKVCRCTLLLTDPTVSVMTCIIFFLLFLNQTLGIMHINSLMLWRVEIFIFGGTDAIVSGEEEYIMQVYLGLLIERLWDVTSLSTCEKLAIMLQLDDDDLQQLVVEESAVKDQVSASIRRFMDRRGHSSKLVAKLQNLVTR